MIILYTLLIILSNYIVVADMQESYKLGYFLILAVLFVIITVLKIL